MFLFVTHKVYKEYFVIYNKATFKRGNMQRQQPQQYPEDDYYGGLPPVEENMELLRLQLEVKNLLEDFEHRVLRGEYKHYDPKSGQEKWMPIPGAKKIINEIGIREILGRVIGKVTIAGKLTYKTDEEIYRDMFYFDMSITELVAKRAELWELDVETAKSIKDAAVDLVWDIVASSRNGFTAINLRSQYSKQDISRSDQAEQGDKKTFLGIPLPGGRR